MTKPWYLSGTIWLNVLATLIALYSLFQTTPIFPSAWLPYFGLLIGVLNIVIRVWFTSGATLTLK